MRNKTLFQNKDYSNEFYKTSVQSKNNLESDLINDLIKQTDYFKQYEDDEDIFEHYKTIEKKEKKQNNKNNKNKNSYSYENNNNVNNEYKNKFSKLGQDIMKNNINNNKSNFLYRNYVRSYNPTLIKYCKKAIFNLRKDLPNYKEIINKINNEFDININHSMVIENNYNNSSRNIYKNISYADTTTPTEANNLLNVRNNNKNNSINSMNVNNLSISTNSEKEDKKKNNNNKKNIEFNSSPFKNKSNIRKSFLFNENEELLKLQKIKAKRKNVLFSAIRFLAYNGLSLENFIHNKILPQKPFELKNSEDFLENVKFNDIEKVKGAIKKDKNYLFQYDYHKQTGFHWAAKLGYDEMLRYMLQHSQACNLYDYKMRTPIYLAALFNQRKCIQVLLEFNGNARICDLKGKKPIDVCTDEKCKDLLNSFVENNNLWKKVNGIKNKDEMFFKENVTKEN